MKAVTIANAHPARWPAMRRWTARHKRWLGAGVSIALGLALGWHALAAAGALYVLACMVPCALMMGMCMKNMGSKDIQNSGSPDTQTDAAASATAPAQPETTATVAQEQDNA